MSPVRTKLAPRAVVWLRCGPEKAFWDISPTKSALRQFAQRFTDANRRVMGTAALILPDMRHYRCLFLLPSPKDHPARLASPTPSSQCGTPAVPDMSDPWGDWTHDPGKTAQLFGLVALRF